MRVYVALEMPTKRYIDVMREQHYILVVDDNRDAADMMAYLLQLSGWNAGAVYNGQAALEAVAQAHPQVLLLDIGMPRMSGLEVAQRLRTTYGDAGPILVALTAWANETMRAQTQALGFAAHVAKPAEMADINSLLESLLDRNLAGSR